MVSPPPQLLNVVKESYCLDCPAFVFIVGAGALFSALLSIPWRVPSLGFEPIIPEGFTLDASYYSSYLFLLLTEDTLETVVLKAVCIFISLWFMGFYSKEC